MEFDTDRRVVGGRLVILVQSSTYFSRLYSNYRIISGCVSDRTLKEVHSYCAFFEALVVPLQAVVDHVRKKLLTALARLKDGAIQDRVQFPKYRGPLHVIEAAAIAVNLIMPNMICCQTHGAHCLPFENIGNQPGRAQ